MDQTVIFQALIVPHRSLSRRGRRVLLSLICLMCCLSSAVFVWLGAWPVGGFTGLELLLAAYLFHLNARSARASELLLLQPDGLRTDPRGLRHEQILPIGWLSAVLEERRGRVPGLFLTGHGHHEEIAATLGEAEKRDLAASLQAALTRWRNPVFDNPQLRP